MASWTNIGAHDVSEETRAFKDKLASKDGQLAAQQDQLSKQAEELANLRRTLKETQYKLGSESDRAVKLETDLQSRSQELRNERLASENAARALAAAQDSLREKVAEARDLEAHLEQLSRTHDNQDSVAKKLQQEKRSLEAHIRELQNDLAQATSQPKIPTRPRSSSVPESQNIVAVEELAQLCASLSAKEVELLAANEKVSHVRLELLNIENEKTAIERRSTKEIASLTAQLEEREAEIDYLQAHGQDDTRERELLQRIEEDEAKIAALEKLTGDAYDTRRLKATLRQAEDDLRAESVRASDLERQLAISNGETTCTQERLEHAENEMVRLKEVLTAQANEISRLRHELIAKADDRMDVDNPHTATGSTSPQSQEIVASQIERLLSAVARLRGERDGLLRNVSFLESEHKATVITMQAEIASLSQSDHAPPNPSFQQAQNDLGLANSRPVQSLGVVRQEILRMGRMATASIVLVQTLSQQVEQLQNQVFATQPPESDPSPDLAKSHQKSLQLEETIQEVRIQLDESLSSLESVTKDRNDLLARLKQHERTSLMESMTGKETVQRLRSDLERAENEVRQLSKALENVESERDSLNLQLTNLADDLKTAQDELTSAETRYSDLQFHQLSSMSSHEVNASLRERIKELEARVLRRTEQIGIHQHDIKRMETNMKLQEERLGELTAELEMMASEKDAMVEDCADAREARDTAILRLEAAEMEMETKMEEGERAVQTLVAVIIETIAAAKERIMKSDHDICSTREELARLEEDYKGALELLEKKEAALTAVGPLTQELQQSTLALAVSQGGLRKALVYIKDILGQKISLRREIATHESLIEQGLAENKTLQLQLSVLREDLTASAASHALQLKELQDKSTQLDTVVQQSETAHRQAIEDMQISNDTLQAKLDHAQKLLDQNNDEKLTKLQSQHEEDTSAIRHRLVIAESEVASLTTALQDKRQELEASLMDAKAGRSDLEQQIAALTNLLQTATEKHTITQGEKGAALSEKAALEETLSETKSALENQQATLEELRVAHQQVSDELARVRQNQELTISTFAEESESSRQQLERDNKDLKASFDQQAQELDRSKAEVANLSRQLASQTDRYALESDHLNAALLSAQQRLRVNEEALQESQQGLEAAQTEVSKLQAEINALSQERDASQEQATNLEAEKQRSISLHRHLENQIKESERRIASLTDDLEQMRAQLGAADQATKTAQANLSLQSAQFKRESSELQRQLSNLQSQPDLHSALAELEERNNEMEELLRKKCAEIEENDDRALEMLKDNKKLTSKVESLNRKVQNLQTKLAAAKAALPKAVDPSISSSTAPALALSPQQAKESNSQLHSSNLDSHLPSVGLNKQRQSPPSSSLPAMGPSEERPTPPAVFKARTPERPIIHPIAAEAMAVSAATSSSSVGKKRRAPDDDDLAEDRRLPAQVFTAESLPSREHQTSNTPRVRRMLNGLQSGFTPKRNQTRHAASPSPRKPSPKKFAFASATGAPQSTAVIHDVTNSPRGASQLAGQSNKEKRGWLTKIRGNHGQTASGRMADTRPKLDREFS